MPAEFPVIPTATDTESPRPRRRRIGLAMILSICELAGCRDFSPKDLSEWASGGSSSQAGTGQGESSSGSHAANFGGSSNTGGGAQGGSGRTADAGGESGGVAGINVQGGGAGGGDAGAGDAGAGDAGAGDAGAGGAGNAECGSDVDCDDHSACDGAESCVLGSCTAGTKVSCSEWLVCRERQAQAACEFALQGPWIVFYGVASTPFFALGLYGVPAPYATNMMPVELSLGAVEADGETLIDYRWSAQGRHLLLNVAGERRALYSIDVGNGWPTAARPVPNLPRDEGQYSIASFAPSVDCAVAQERGLLFKICVGASGVETDLIYDHAEPDLDLEGARYCSGATALLLSSQLFDLRASNREPESLPGFEISPDGTRMIRGAVDGLEVRPCSLGSSSALIGLPADAEDADVTWAPDSRHAVLYADSSSEELLLVDVNSTADAVRWRVELNDPERFSFEFSADSEYLLVENGATFSLISVASGTEVALPLPEGVTSVWWADDGVTLLLQRALTPGKYTAAWWLSAPLASPELIFETDIEGVNVAVSPRAGLAIVATGSSEPILSRIDLNDLAAGPRKLRPSLPLGLLSEPEIAADGSGVLLTSPGESQDDLYWLSLRGESEGGLVRLNAGNSTFGEFQPWP